MPIKKLGVIVSSVPDVNASPLKTRRVILLFILWIVLFCICACWAIWDGGYYFTSLTFPDPPRWKPSVNDIVGKWRLSDNSIKFIQNTGNTVPFHEIEFWANGTFKATNIPELIRSDEITVWDFYTGYGTWSFEKIKFRPWSIVLYYDDIESQFEYSRISTRFSFHIQGIEPPFKLYDSSVESLIFERK